ncbi:MAG TPA: hypothetical protein VFM04_07885, partial [Candidatus Methylomirabilis sp.]|nr:hypothetical protein [Candidatus Methylomirabilis sp.]
RPQDPGWLAVRGREGSLRGKTEEGLDRVPGAFPAIRGPRDGRPGPARVVFGLFRLAVVRQAPGKTRE